MGRRCKFSERIKETTMRNVLLLLALTFIGCAPDGDDTTINIADGNSNAGDPITQSECAGSDDQCAQQVDE